MSTFGIANWGPIVVSTDVDEAILAVLKKWMPTYINRMSAERGLSYKLPVPKTYSNYIDLDEILDHHLPAIVVTTAKAHKTMGGANSIISAEWDVQVSAIMRGTSPPSTKSNTSLVEGAIRRCMVQKCRDNAGILSNTHWLDSEIGPLKTGTREGRYLAAGIGKYNVATDAAAQSFGGPDVPDATSYAPLAVVTDVVIDVESEE